MSKNAKFWNDIADKYARKPVDDEAAYEDTLSLTRARLSGHERVLEIGCGTGTTALKLAPHVGKIIATDIAERMIEIAEAKRAAAGAGNVTFLAAGLGDATLPLGPFDVVFAFNVFHLADDVPAALAAAATRLKPGGLLISKTALIGDGAVFLRPMISIMRLFGKAPAVSSLTESGFGAMVEAAGFQLEEAKTYPGMAPARFLVARKLG